MDLSAIVEALKAGKQPLGNGMLGQAAQANVDRPYQLYVQQTVAEGGQPIPREQFMQQMLQPQSVLAPPRLR